MGPTSPLPAIASLLLALGTCALIYRGSRAPEEFGRFATIDGLRGYLAIFVFISHGSLWYFYLRSGHWEMPPSRMYSQMGQGSVAIFFMITGFLFFSKLIRARTVRLDWERLYVSRLLRLGPLYFLAVGILFAIVWGVTDGVLHESRPLLVKHVAEWLAFSVIGGPNLNGVPDTAVVLAGVTWTMQYEWFFYLSLPLIALCAGVRVPTRFLILGVLSIAAFAALRPNVYCVVPFACGIASARLARWGKFCDFCRSPAASVVAIASAAAAVGCSATVYAPLPLSLLFLSFAIIACGNGLFGALVHPVSLVLGRMAYSVYLLHGILLFVSFDLILGSDRASRLTVWQHWLVVLALTPLLTLLCHLTFRLIERPAMSSTARVMASLRRRGAAASA